MPFAKENSKCNASYVLLLFRMVQHLVYLIREIICHKMNIISRMNSVRFGNWEVIRVANFTVGNSMVGNTMATLIFFSLQVIVKRI